MTQKCVYLVSLHKKKQLLNKIRLYNLSTYTLCTQGLQIKIYTCTFLFQIKNQEI